MLGTEPAFTSNILALDTGHEPLFKAKTSHGFGAALERARMELSTWLLSPAVARQDDMGQVGVINWLDPDSDAYDGLYPEIGGYYLSFLAQVAPEHGDLLCRAKAAGVLRWFERMAMDGSLSTIERATMQVGDWRNHCIFTFDVAMILRGMLIAERRWPGTVKPELLARYAAMAEEIGDEDQLGSHLLRKSSGSMFVPVKWSTRRDVHHVKAAAALAELAHPVAAKAEATLRHWRAQKKLPLRELHPALYLIEGWLIEWSRTRSSDDLVRAAAVFDEVLSTIDRETCGFPACFGVSRAVSRGDVQAQVLRAGSILARADALSAAAVSLWEELAPGITENLLARLSRLGGVAFDNVQGHRNSWASMFAWQALTFARATREEHPHDDAGLLI